MRRLTLLVFAAFLAALAQSGRPNFSGTWELALAKSDFGRYRAPKKVTLTIKHQEPKIGMSIAMEVPRGRFQTEATYTTDGTLNTNRDRNMAIRTRSHWEKQQLVLEGLVEGGKSPVKVVERWSLADQGKTFINERVLSLPKGDMKQKLVYTKTK
jgi:hypothetical protein